MVDINYIASQLREIRTKGESSRSPDAEIEVGEKTIPYTNEEKINELLPENYIYKYKAGSDQPELLLAEVGEERENGEVKEIITGKELINTFIGDVDYDQSKDMVIGRYEMIQDWSGICLEGLSMNLQVEKIYFIRESLSYTGYPWTA